LGLVQAWTLEPAGGGFNWRLKGIVIHGCECYGEAYAGGVYIEFVVDREGAGFVAGLYAEVAALAFAVFCGFYNELICHLQCLVYIDFVIGGILVELSFVEKFEVDGECVIDRSVYLGRYIDGLQGVHEDAGEGCVVSKQVKFVLGAIDEGWSTAEGLGYGLDLVADHVSSLV